MKMSETNKIADSAVVPTIRRSTVKLGKMKWFDILTTAWAIALLLVALTWVASPAFARPGSGGGEYGCWSGCNRFCEDSGGCDYVNTGEGGMCRGYCEDGTPYKEGCGEV